MVYMAIAVQIQSQLVAGILIDTPDGKTSGVSFQPAEHLMLQAILKPSKFRVMRLIAERIETNQRRFL